MVAITPLLLGSLAASLVSATPLSKSCRTYDTDLTDLVDEVPEPQHFCDAFLASKKAKSPIKSFTTKRLTQTCKCGTNDRASARMMRATPKGDRAGLAGAAAASVCKNVQLAKVLSGIKNVQFFCSTFNPSQWHHGSPIAGATPQLIQQACQCILNAGSPSPSSQPSPSSSQPSPPPSSPSSQPAPQPGPGGPPQPFHFCPSDTRQIKPFQLFCKTPLWKTWACSCSTVAQVCYPNGQMPWCPQPQPSSISSSSPAPAPTLSTVPSSSAAPTTTSAIPSTTTIPTTTTAPASTSSSPAATTTPSPPATTDAPAVSSSTSTDASADATTTADSPASSTS